ncbi:MAG: (4Fe-4S)-binding protein [Puia sp.]|nr:(4Fe-4S)-binding protein [Puia sp.]
MSQKTFHYTRDGVTVVWKPEVCIHSAICFHGLPEVFDPRRRPWIDMNQAPTDRIIAQVEKCPSGALSYYFGEPEMEKPV